MKHTEQIDAKQRCPRCKSTATKRGPGKGPHFAALHCADCGRWLKWLPKPVEQNQRPSDYLDACVQFAEQDRGRHDAKRKAYAYARRGGKRARRAQ